MAQGIEENPNNAFGYDQQQIRAKEAALMEEGDFERQRNSAMSPPSAFPGNNPKMQDFN